MEQGQPQIVEPAVVQGPGPAALQGQPQPEPAVDPALQRFVAPEPAAAPADPQGTPQGQPPNEDARHWQSLYSRTLAEKYALEQRLNTQSPQSQVQTPAQEQNPYDANQDFARWWGWEKSDMAHKSAQLSNEGFMQQLGTIAQQQAEYNWQASHPGVDINSVRAYARSQGIADWNLDAAYRLMSLPQTVTSVARAQAQQAINGITQPQTGAIPLRAAPASTGGEVGMYYEKLAAEYQRTNGAIAASWPPELQKAFRDETYRREVASRQG